MLCGLCTVEIVSSKREKKADDNELATSVAEIDMPAVPKKMTDSACQLDVQFSERAVQAQASQRSADT